MADIDEFAIERNYLASKNNRDETSVLPLVFEFTNSPPAIG